MTVGSAEAVPRGSRLQTTCLALRQRKSVYARIASIIFLYALQVNDYSALFLELHDEVPHSQLNILLFARQRVLNAQ